MVEEGISVECWAELMVGYKGLGYNNRSPVIISSSAPSSCPSRFPAKGRGSKVGVGKYIMQLRQDVSGISLNRLLCNCPFATVNNKVYCWKINGKRGEGG